MVMTAVMFGFVFGQTPIIRVKQIGTWKTPEYWWKNQETVQLQTFLADDSSVDSDTKSIKSVDKECTKDILVFSGGAIKGLALIGVLKALEVKEGFYLPAP